MAFSFIYDDGFVNDAVVQACAQSGCIACRNRCCAFAFVADVLLPSDKDKIHFGAGMRAVEIELAAGMLEHFFGDQLFDDEPFPTAPSGW